MALSYTKTGWQDRLSSNPGQFTATGTVPGTITLQLNDNPTQTGTPVTAAAMNNIENGVSQVTTEVNNHEANHSNPHAVTPGQIGAAPSGYGFGDADTPSISDMNSPKSNSVQWFGNTTPNIPEATWGHVSSFSPDGGSNITQMVLTTTTNRVWMRTKVNGTWGGWIAVQTANTPPVLTNSTSGVQYYLKYDSGGLYLQQV
ncbi:hypothetical protein DEAC_c23650 [Desulfosporosinus acididurans]|uniref:Uncharacterized protein n=1 Tax=Desulfosporosinus acididurans TaxID=476652 RepID=A0A0J1FQF2_9FIRM|nr:pyocin knob domain-containing protein [Desulfosporosinus acididurans]KLU65735.1 hypothetical protein DEAC_c23650 [Desulfosporosinus acididurans]